MSTWVKWWTNPTFMTVLVIALSTMAVAFVCAYFISWGWILSIISTAIGAFSIRYIIKKRLDNLSKR